MDSMHDVFGSMVHLSYKEHFEKKRKFDDEML